jgi:hypothetical protein
MNTTRLWAKGLLQKTERKTGITVNGICLPASERDRSLYAQALVLLRETEDMLPDEAAREEFRKSQQSITDMDHKVHSMSVTELRALLVAFGTAYQALWNAANQSD